MNTLPLPVATCRLQLTPTFGFEAAAGVAAYIRDLGASHLYLSPIFQARAGSTHGYDQTDPRRVRDELGGDEGFAELVSRAHRAGLGLLLDIVPNHMAADHANPWWWGMLREGPDSVFSRFFDVDWAAGGGKVVLPVLGRPLEEAVEAGEIVLEADPSLPRGRGGASQLRYADKLFPIRAGTTTKRHDLLAVLNDQHYTLMHWRAGREALNYRRFFDISELAGVRVEDPEVFEVLHSGILGLAARGMVDGVRIDHIDGLADPAAYLRRLRRRLDEVSARAGTGRRVLVIVEKILAHGERLPGSWDVDGTTGYEFAVAATGLAICWDGFERLHDDAVRTGAAGASFNKTVVRAKAMAATDLLAPELDRVTALSVAAARAAGLPGDAALLRRALVALSAELDVYRTYLDDGPVGAEDAERIRAAGARAADRHGPETGAIDLLVRALLREPPFDHPQARDAVLRLARAWQQLTGPLAAKGVEDTALYRECALPALNEVGGGPVRWDATSEMRALLQDRAAAHRCSLNATATHDTKRGEDTRARLAALSCSAPSVISVLEEARAALAGELDPADLRLLVFTSLALMPLEGPMDDTLVDRLKAYMHKATREAKVHNNWLEPDKSYEQACDACVEWLARDEAGEGARDRMRAVARATRSRADVELLGAVLLKCLAPGVPDFYQGCEFMDLSLVDPDNRRPVDWKPRVEELHRITGAWRSDPSGTAARWLARIGSDAAKLYVTWRALAVRRWLLEAGDRLELVLFEATPSRRCWITACADRCCRVEMGNAPRADGVDQLTGRGAGETLNGWPFSVTLEQSATPGPTGLVG